MAHRLRSAARKIQKETGAKYQACLRIAEQISKEVSPIGENMIERIIQRSVEKLKQQGG